MKPIHGLVLLAACLAALEVAAEPETIDRVIAVDAEFASLALERGQQVAFQEYLAADGIVFRPTAVTGRDWLATHEQASGRLEWTPVAGATACNGQLAVTTGPWSYSNPDSSDVAAGHYLSVWRRDADGRWRILLDHGIDHAPRAVPSVALAAAFATLWPDESPRNCRASRGAQTLADAEREFDDTIRSKGLAGALRQAAADGALVYRDDVPPGPVASASQATDGAFAAGSEARPQLVSAEPGSNMGYSYGEISSKSEGSALAARAVYVRIWRSDGKRWRVAIDMMTTLPPAGT
jgi:ketosteroid isomerase-like protein